MHEVLVNCLFKLAQETSVVIWTGRSAMTIAVDLGRKATKQTNKQIILEIAKLVWIQVHFKSSISRLLRFVRCTNVVRVFLKVHLIQNLRLAFMSGLATMIIVSVLFSLHSLVTAVSLWQAMHIHWYCNIYAVQIHQPITPSPFCFGVLYKVVVISHGWDIKVVLFSHTHAVLILKWFVNF